MDTPSLKGVTNTLDGVVKLAHEKCLSSPLYASAAMGKLISPIPLTQFPVIRSFHPRPLIIIMEPRQHPGYVPKHMHINNVKALAGGGKDAGASSNPFIYSPFTPGQKKGAKRKEVLWVEGDPAEIGLSIANPLPFELRVEKMVSFDCGTAPYLFCHWGCSGTSTSSYHCLSVQATNLSLVLSGSGEYKLKITSHLS